MIYLLVFPELHSDHLVARAPPLVRKEYLMSVIFTLTNHNTTEHPVSLSNLKVTVPLSEEWSHISRHSHIYVATELLIPVIASNQETIQTLTLQNYFRTDSISDTTNPCVYQYGVVHGTVISIKQIQFHCRIWAYDIST